VVVNNEEIMKTSWLNRKLFPVLILIFLFTSCNNDADNNNFEVFADAYMVKKLMDDEVKTAAAFYAYGNADIASVTVTPPIDGGEPFELSRSPESSYTFFKDPVVAEFRTELPPTGTYQFDAKSTRGENILREDLLKTPGLDIPVIDSTRYHPESLSLQVNWQSVQGADGYVLKLLNAEGLTVFISYAIVPTAEELVINSTSGNWETQASPGDNLTLQVQAFVYESDATNEINIYNIGEIAIGEQEIIWGQ
jgi:hypothetical protein